ncbi:MAG: ornithine carbamoyltransferase [Actinobacteria bacterium 13_2_20CM_2_66_6]|nr:MAG: ornithine carbamoyltransferase [Actinobacteria bacterium 13_2_20CM_2_66_6]TME91356.1 MAG: ornithine carbamoyltransferase [Chloroflexota bacterium]
MSGLFGRDFLDVADFEAAELRRVLDLAHQIKAGTWSGRPLAGRHIAMLFQRPSHRTRVSFEVGISRLGGATTTLGEQDVQLGVRETVGDAARVLDRYVDGIVARLRTHADLTELADAAEKPVINALTDRSHPCQVLADLVTLEEVGGPLTAQKVVYVGDGNNIATSLIEASARLDFPLTVITPAGYAPDEAVVARARSLSRDGDRVTITSDLSDLDGATAIYTDVWTSMGQESERQSRRKIFAEYQVNPALMAGAPKAVFMHCLPAHRGEEVTDEVIDGPRSVVLQQAGNRLYAQMALMSELFGKGT